MLKNILGRIFALYALLLFAGTMLVVFLPIWLLYLWQEPIRTKGFLAIGRVWMKVYMPLIGCPVSRKGLEHFKKDQTYVIVCNHNSLIDVPVTTSGIPGANKTLAKASMGKIPLFNVLYKIGGILVDRSSEASRKQSVEDMKHALSLHLHILLYPEGTRNRTPEPLKPFYDGAFALAIDTQLPLMPSLLFHTRKILPAHKKFFAWPHPIEYHLLPPIPTAGLTRDDLPALKEKVFQLMWHYYTHYDKKWDQVTA
ncbi:lysophospholipid acyltransferase family protein [Chitinophaga nivalis]|uniref:1-acyl-sn-glycerol-3-phosphate acyltransferase n=1 Tax=Chitinophaga nivalis TaxID=2991709 RepID=A0ABT3IPQ1_9BACT|nr:1-acyl-sn-glycerol-3-phosphate acyltransferase [Chitinophaga nivalis]MCW3464357.1 1-acyl-sn-glycerol-3-phosphate acyltransferase [Chitinophaga nivalis]MCW3485952.1 1-acyl-sn-glycerol-3-phosphate acyltransferase [Chitinophaga nivalis]